MAAIDALSLLIIGLSALHGAWRGFTRHALGFVSWGIAIVLALRFHAAFLPFVQRFITSPTGAQIGSFALLLLGVLCAGYVLSAAIVRIVKATPLDALDRLLGLLFGIVRGMFLVVVLFMAAQWLLQPQDMAALTEDSRLTPYIRLGASHIQPYLPDLSAKGVARNPSTGHDATL
ncbi:MULTISPECIES: CvpA family protein [Acetobacter]|uniref:CvpA family protein n=1 Tax=Acetobacter oryzoeni TaxID=2500548 RepID=A0A5B9GJV8_9PROT|nr:CvpA family protein [Acetobacter oryzoeni]MCP1202943.1 CvpA family protein [Acetobacter oryzoeni]QEE86333.1 CvpA family protein [Acetobacter oryzoeni]